MFNIGIVNIKFHQIVINEKLTKDILTPAKLENLILKQFTVQPGDFLFMEWEKLNEEILVTSERTALFAPDASTH